MSGSLQTPCSPGALHEQSWLQAHVLSLNPCLRLRQEGLHLLLLIHKIALGERMVLVLSWCSTVVITSQCSDCVSCPLATRGAMIGCVLLGCCSVPQ